MTRWAIALGIALAAGVCMAQNQQAWFSQTLLMQPRKAAAGGSTPLNITNLVAHWLMNDNAANTTVLDNKAFTNGVAARNTSTISTNGKVNAALYFNNSSSDWINIGTGQILNYNTNYSIVAWIWINSIPYTTENAIVDYGAYRRFTVGGSVWGNQLFATYGGAGNLRGSTTLTTGRWYHVAHVVTYGAGANAKFYLDGTNDTASGVAPDVSAPAGQQNTIGRNGWETSGYFDGRIDDVRIYSRALTSNEVLAIYNGGSGTEEE